MQGMEIRVTKTRSRRKTHTRRPARADDPMSAAQRAELEPLLRRIPGMVDVREYLSGLTHDDAQWMIVELSFPRFRKHDQRWAVLGTPDHVRPGPVEVHKKDGTSTHVQVRSVSKPFDHMGRRMVHGFI